jgi:dephospho-CoA kinase
MPALRLGLTGGIGSGKSTVAALFARRGIPVIDADVISRQCTSAQGAAMESIRAKFGAKMVAADGGLDRNAMRALAFSDPTARRMLQGIVHPLVGLEIAVQAQAAERANASCIVFDIPLLTESVHWRGRLHRVLVIDCSEATQRARVLARDRLNEQSVHQIISAQSTRVYRLRCADIVIHNDGIGMEELSAQVAAITQSFEL